MIDPGLGLPLRTAFVLRLRHGIDWDHIAAIADVTSAPRTTRSRVLLGTMYAAGHSLVVITIGALSVLFGVKLPNWVAGYMEPVVGGTLILLGLFISNTGISLGCVFGYVSSRGNRRFYLGMSAVTGVMSGGGHAGRHRARGAAPGAVWGLGDDGAG